MVRKELADKISKQALSEISEARLNKAGKLPGWQKNEQMYYKEKVSIEGNRANVSLSQTQEFVHTILANIDNPMIFKFIKRKNSQLERAKYLNSIRAVDAEKGFWDLKDIVGKKQAIIYGRAIYAYYASSINGIYESHLDPVDVYDFLIDPSANGIDIESAMYMGHWGVVKTISQLREGVRAKLYHSNQVKDIIDNGSGTNDVMVQEEINKQQRSFDTETMGDKNVQNANKYKFWQWITTYDGVRYYILMDNSGNWIRCEVLKDLFSSDLFPYWSWAPFPDLTEFWTPSYVDYAREIFMAQEVTINQMLDNAEEVNKPERFVQVGAIDDVSKIQKYKKNRITLVKKGFNADQAIQFGKVPSIQTPMVVFDKLQAINDRASGENAISAGASDPKGKVGIYEGNQAAVAGRFGLLNKSYAFGYKRFAKLYEWGIKDNLNKKVAVDIIGPSGVEVKQIKKTDIYKGKEEFGCIVEASDVETTNSRQNQDTKLKFLSSKNGDQNINQKKLIEMEGKVAGLTDEEIRELLDVNDYGNEKVMSEADRDIETLLDGGKIEPVNQIANNAYKQRMVDYLRDHQEDISDKQFEAIRIYIELLSPVIMRNEVSRLNKEIINGFSGTAPVVPGQP